ncbi:MAG TPA: 50S ribosomal protein L23 [Candidatus Paceibacterota bacterium]|nr:50S ribosomal protein L23 [Candidatus Pacearchaeota archaeon]HRZ50950.1 50S ribosomal protein L23 [Candidatus Paceibacterota bacterium]HSA36671.1 50S ribosomal protein L23 [Candidatus Paceibacterota bacterium]
MAITNIFNKKEEGKNTNLGSNPAKSAAKVKNAKKKMVSAAKNPEKTIVAAKDNASVYRIIRNPHITEKATRLAEINQYVFKVFDNINKDMIKKAVEDYYGVKVVAVRMVNIHSRKKRRGKGVAIKQGYKKAIVAVAKGQTIEVLPR